LYSYLATNQLDKESWSDEQLLVHYKQQQGIESSNSKFQQFSVLDTASLLGI
jgi:hypothetical protein